MRCLFITLIKNDKGQSLVEYALIISLIILVVILVLEAFGLGVLDYYNNMNAEIEAIIHK